MTDSMGNPLYGSLQHRRLLKKKRDAVASTAFANSSSFASASTNGGSYSYLRRYHHQSTSTVSRGRASSSTMIMRRSTLMTCVMSRSWDSVVDRARRYPHEIAQLDYKSGNLPIHAAARLNPPVEVVRELMGPLFREQQEDETTMMMSTLKQLYHRDVGQGGEPGKRENHFFVNRDGWTVLHLAASHNCALPALKAIVEFEPMAILALSRRTQRTPLHCAASSFRGMERNSFIYLMKESVKVMSKGESQESVSAFSISVGARTTSVSPLCHKDSMGHTPMSLLFRRFRERLKEVCATIDDQKLEPDQAMALVRDNNDLGSLWEKAVSTSIRFRRTEISDTRTIPYLTKLILIFFRK